MESSQPALNTLSVILPVYNEAATAGQLIDTVVSKPMPGWKMEVIIIESNSTDGTRDIVLKYKDHPRVKLILEDRPRGKGHAARAGLDQATGDYVLIQDGDLEYDPADYEKLLAPLVAGTNTFVLGSRYADRWSIRKLSDQPIRGLYLNLGHWFFAMLINVSFFTWLNDPFTMYKVFRRDAIKDLKFESNRFDFDWELLMKLMRKGHYPLEIPISYKARSFKDGKKTALVRDPLNWICAFVKYRFCRL